MTNIKFRDWESWKNYSIGHRGIRDYLRDHLRVNGAGVRIFQYLIMPSRSERAVSYDFFAQPSLLHIDARFNPISASLVRCQEKSSLNSSEVQPSFEYHTADYPVEKLLRILDELKALSLPNVFEHLPYIQGYDGSDYEFAFNTLREAINMPVVTYLRYHWWSEPSPGLIPLAEYWEQLRPSLDTQLDDNSSDKRP
jgi:hypothetical protein